MNLQNETNNNNISNELLFALALSQAMDFTFIFLL